MIDSILTCLDMLTVNISPDMNRPPELDILAKQSDVQPRNMPSSTARDIESMFDKGVRFWKNHNNIGNYNLDNAPA